ncbi:MAG TPA: hypothetical protein VF584_02505 [Longimicrobium sp.]|jgi:DNA-binding Lrp family transcriptional regulator
MAQITLRPADLVVGLALLAGEKDSYEVLSARLRLSAGAVHASVRRLVTAGLVRDGSKCVHRRNLAEFTLHGARYAFPAILGPSAGGVPTAYAAPPLSDEIVFDEPVVWPSIGGSMRGTSLTPLYPGAPELVHSAPELYRALALVDALRIGRARERGRAAELLRLVICGEGA